MKQLMTKLPPAARTKIEKAGKAGTLFNELLTQARQVAADEKQQPAERAAAARTLSLAEFGPVQGLLGELLTFRQPEVVQRAALESLRWAESALQGARQLIESLHAAGGE